MSTTPLTQIIGCTASELHFSAEPKKTRHPWIGINFNPGCMHVIASMDDDAAQLVETHIRYDMTQTGLSSRESSDKDAARC